MATQDKHTTIAQLKEKVEVFMHERDWRQFHAPKNMSMAIAVEAAELMEHFLWVDAQESYRICEEKRTDVSHELIDVMFACLELADILQIDIATAFEEKLALNRQKYPVEKVKGKSDKYTAYMQCKEAKSNHDDNKD